MLRAQVIRFAVGHFDPIREESFFPLRVSLSLYFSVTTVHRSDLFGTFFFICQYSIPCSIDVSTSIRGCLRLYACTVEAFTLNVYIFQLENSLYASVRDVEAIGRHTCNGHIYNLVNCNHCHYRVVTHCKFSISLWMLHVLAPSTSNPRTSSKRKRKLIVIFIFIANFHCGAIDVCVVFQQLFHLNPVNVIRLQHHQ